MALPAYAHTTHKAHTKISYQMADHLIKSAKTVMVEDDLVVRNVCQQGNRCQHSGLCHYVLLLMFLISLIRHPCPKCHRFFYC